MLLPEISLAGLHIGPIPLPVIPLILAAVFLLLPGQPRIMGE